MHKHLSSQISSDGFGEAAVKAELDIPDVLSL